MPRQRNRKIDSVVDTWRAYFHEEPSYKLAQFIINLSCRPGIDISPLCLIARIHRFNPDNIYAYLKALKPYPGEVTIRRPDEQSHHEWLASLYPTPVSRGLAHIGSVFQTLAGRFDDKRT